MPGTGFYGDRFLLYIEPIFDTLVNMFKMHICCSSPFIHNSENDGMKHRIWRMQVMDCHTLIVQMFLCGGPDPHSDR